MTRAININHTYAVFCDGNDLRRLDTTPEEHLRNLDVLASALLALRKQYSDEIENRCDKCGGTGRKS